MVEKSSPVEVKWTAYKTPQKIGVNGGFMATVCKGKEKAEDLKELLVKSRVMLEVNNVDTKNPQRDAKLVQFFFNLMQGAMVEADIVSLEGDDASGTMVVNVYMNNRSVNVPLAYRVEEGKFWAKGSLDLADFKALEALRSLTLNCYALHEGKTWSDVDIGFSFDLLKHCD